MSRAFDLLLAIPLALVSAPVCALLLLLVRLDSPGSPLFSQVRVGRDKRPFRMYKIRTMSVDTSDRPSHETGAGGMTRLGPILRRLKLDELPQLANVIAGSMSLLGPRPCLPSQHELIEARDRLGVFAWRPGIAGPAQIAGIDMSQPQLLAEVEAGYFTQSNLRSDISLLVQTVIGRGSGDAATKGTDK